jgi:hypothetical protein
MQCGILNISQPYRTPRPVTGIVLLFNKYYRGNEFQKYGIDRAYYMNSRDEKYSSG